MSQSDVSKAEAPISGRSRLGPSFDELERLPGQIHPGREDPYRAGGLPPRGLNDLCREGIKPHSYYSWTKEFMEAGRGVSRDTVRDATRQEIQDLKRENGELKQLVAELSLEVYRLKKTAIPMPQNGVGTSGRRCEGDGPGQCSRITAGQARVLRDGCSQEHLIGG